MAQTIKLRRSATAGATPTTSQLELGEVAINTYDGKMYIKKSVGGTESIVELGSGLTPADAILEEYLYTATASQTAFSGNDDNSDFLSYTAGALQVFLNGILLDPETDYTATNGATITLTAAAALNDYLQIFAFKKKIGDSSITINSFTGNNSTTAYTLTLDPGDENNTRVFIDGVYQSKSNYTVSGTTLTFSSAPPSGTGIEVEIGNRAVSLDTASNLDLPDNVKLRLGTSQDLEIYHDGSNSYIDEGGTGKLILESNSAIKLQTSGGGETLANFNNQGAVELFYDNGKKFETTSTGATVTGNIAVTGTVDGRDVASDGAAAVAALPRTGGAMTGAITTNSTFDGRDVATDGSKLDGIEAGATADQTQSEINALGITATGLSGTPAISVANITTTGELRGPASLVIDPAAVGDNTGTVVIKGNLQVDGATTTINSTTLTVDDLNLTLASGAANGTAANGAGITVDGASATLTYQSTGDNWNFNKNLNVTGTVFFNSDLRANNVSNKLILKASSSTTELHAAGTSGIVFKDAGNGQTASLDNGGNLLLNGLLSAEDNIYLTDAGTVRGKLLLNSSDRDNVELRAESLGSTMKFFTVGTQALLLDSSQNATFAGDVGMATGHSSGKFAVMSSSVHGSYDFYNNGTSYFNGSVTVDDVLNVTGTNKAIQMNGVTRINGVGDIIGTSYYVGANAVIDTSRNITAGTISSGAITTTGDTTIKNSGVAKLKFAPLGSTYGAGFDVMTVTGTSSSPYTSTIGFSNYGVTDAMVIQGNNVGIGTSTVLSKLHVAEETAGAGRTDIRISRSVDSSAVNRKFALIMGTNASNLGSTWRMETESSTGYNDNATLNWIHNGGGTDKSPAMSILHGGNVGIGTTSPGTPLTVNGGTESFSLEISETQRMTMGADGTWNYIKAKSGQGFRFSTTGAGDVLALTNGGDVGIGTTAPGVPLHVYNASQGRVAIENSSRRFDLTVDADGLSFRDQSAAATRMILDTSGNLTFNGEGQKLIFNTSSTAAHGEIYTGDTFGSNRLIIEGENGIHNVIDGNSNSVGDWSVYNERLAAHQIFLTGTNGYFGIGTTSPDSKLTVNTTTTGDGIELQSSEVSIAKLSRAVVDSTVVASLDGVAGRPIHVGGAVNEDVILANGGGNVGIGDVSPDYKLHVTSGTTNVVAKFESTDSTSVIQFVDPNGNCEFGTTGSIGRISPAGSYAVLEASQSAVVINNAAQDTDFRVESGGNANMFKVDAGENQVLIATSSTFEPSNYGLYARNGLIVGNFSGTGNGLTVRRGDSLKLNINHDSTKGFVTTGGNPLHFRTSEDANYKISMETDGVVINENGQDYDFRVESDGNANMLFVDGGNDKVSVGGINAEGDTFGVITTGTGSSLRLV